ncbi:MAG TPA: hypothetical protein VFH95_07095, partial [Candidatus Kapabacteria bacterium]|nr:hypothetical protein [Candidatus Kapabacteria bacterium]
MEKSRIFVGDILHRLWRHHLTEPNSLIPANIVISQIAYQGLRNLLQIVEKLKTLNPDGDVTQIEDFEGEFDVVDSVAHDLELESIAEYLDDWRVTAGKKGLPEIKHLGEMLDVKLFKLFRNEQVKLLSAEEAHWYNDGFPFSDKVLKLIPGIKDDANEAPKCIALERYTAAVFHVMRIAECGVQVLAKRLHVKLHKNNGTPK